jgi:hypothetical protein
VRLLKVRDKTNPLKERPLRNPGQSLDEELDELLNEQLLILLIAPIVLWIWSAMEWFARWRHAPRTPEIYALMAFGVTVFCGWRVIKLRKKIKSVRLGRDGERFVGQYLDGLRASGARVFHDVLADGFNLDHVVVSERGIFAIETKTWTKLDSDSSIRVEAGQVYKNGLLVNPNPIRQAVAEADWLQQLIRKSTGNDYAVRPVVLFPGWWVERMDKATKDIAWVLPHTALPKWFGYESSKLASDEVNMIAFHLDRYIRASESEKPKR